MQNTQKHSASVHQNAQRPPSTKIFDKNGFSSLVGRHSLFTSNITLTRTSLRFFEIQSLEELLYLLKLLQFQSSRTLALALLGTLKHKRVWQ